MMNRELHEVFDQQELTTLISRYAHAVDSRDAASTVACFAHDAHVEFDGGVEVVDGRDALVRFFEGAFNSPRMGRTGVSTHMMSNVIVTVTGDTAHVETQAIAYHASDDRDTVIVRGLRYSDDCVRSEEGWLIGRRVHRSIWQSEAPGRPVSADRPGIDR
jgi:ketosteroid isomerase-like protein